jgi:mannose-6-phosphate isomerase-like protein (cupin superfamily)
MDKGSFQTGYLDDAPREPAPDGSTVARLVGDDGASMVHVTLPAGQTSSTIVHERVAETWYFLGGRGELWRSAGDREETIDVHEGVAITLPAGTAFQFRTVGDMPLTAVCVTLPPWSHEARWHSVEGPWRPTVGRALD